MGLQKREKGIRRGFGRGVSIGYDGILKARPLTLGPHVWASAHFTEEDQGGGMLWDAVSISKSRGWGVVGPGEPRAAIQSAGASLFHPRRPIISHLGPSNTHTLPSLGTPYRYLVGTYLSLVADQLSRHLVVTE